MRGWQRASWTFAGAAVIAVGAIVVVRDLRARADARAAAATFEPVKAWVAASGPCPSK